MPDPAGEASAYAEAVVGQCRALVEASDGGALVLFTCTRCSTGCTTRSRPTQPCVDGRCSGTRRTAPPPRCWRASARTARRAARTLTFWQGVGRAGRGVALGHHHPAAVRVPDTRSPSARETIRARGGDPFLDDALPQAILTFRQGFGRLIRSHRIGAWSPCSTRVCHARLRRDVPGFAADCRHGESRGVAGSSPRVRGRVSVPEAGGGARPDQAASRSNRLSAR